MGAYLFKHALVQDTAYGTLLREQRRAQHARIVEVFKHRFAEIADRQPELLARHCAEASLLMEACEYHLLAASRATAAMNNKEAAANVKREVTLLEQVPPSDPRRNKLCCAAFMRPAGWFS